MAELDLDSEKDVLIGQFPSKSIKVLWQSFWCRFTHSKNFVKENFDQVFDGKLWSTKRIFTYI